MFQFDEVTENSLLCVHLLKSEVPVSIDSRSTCKEAAMLHLDALTAAQNEAKIHKLWAWKTSDQVISDHFFPFEAITCAHRVYSNVVEHF